LDYIKVYLDPSQPFGHGRLG